MTAMKLQESHVDALSELMNIGVGRAAGMLNEMIGSPIELYVPRVQVLRASDLAGELAQAAADVLSCVRLPFRGEIQGTAALLFPPDSAANLVAALTHEEPGSPDLDAVRAGTLSEVGNIVINGVMGSIGNILRVPLSYDLPTYLEAPLDHLFRRATRQEEGQSPAEEAADPTVLLAHTRFTVEDLEIHGTILLVFEVLSFDALLAAIDSFPNDG